MERCAHYSYHDCTNRHRQKKQAFGVQLRKPAFGRYFSLGLSVFSCGGFAGCALRLDTEPPVQNMLEKNMGRKSILFPARVFCHSCVAAALACRRISFVGLDTNLSGFKSMSCFQECAKEFLVWRGYSHFDCLSPEEEGSHQCRRVIAGSPCRGSTIRIPRKANGRNPDDVSLICSAIPILHRCHQFTIRAGQK